ncbi:hypothetical protein M3Y97_00576300 [Aphelenchoides bicaudatus]|nr:hypothetical protein M3Y97_00576300 [Aphelenchoides bicaudatus]
MSTSRTLALVLLVSLQALVHCSCNDGKNNIVQVADASKNNIIQVTDGVGQSYYSNWQPSCYKNSANLQLPGILSLVSGTINVGKKMKVIGNSKALLTLKKDSIFVGTVCEDGKSTNFLVPDSDCTIDLCSVEGGLCSTLEIPGIHKLGELEGDVNTNGTILLPKISSALKPLIKGKWQLQVKLQVGNEIALHVKVPSNQDWLWLDE